MTTLLQIKMNQKSREATEKRELDQKRTLLLLIQDYLLREGLLDTLTNFQREAGIRKNQFELAENIDLEIMYRGFSDFFSIKFGKNPVYFRKKTTFIHANKEKGNSSNLNRNRSSKTGSVSKEKRKKSKKKRPGKAKKKGNGKDKKEEFPSSADMNYFSVSKIGEKATKKEEKKKVIESAPDTGVDENIDRVDDGKDDFFTNRLMKPLPLYFGEYKDLAESIKRDIIVQNPQVHWDDIVGLESAKKLVVEAVVMPIKYPSLFQGVLQPWRGILLFGPPGTGKTMLAKAVATQCKTTFFNISASTVVSKWRGDSEKLIRVLFTLAKHYAPSTIFIDELDSILCQRRDREHEASRRMKTELLIQMDGLAREKEHIFLLAASNVPWDLDNAVLRRLEKRILVGLPNEKARERIFEKLLSERAMEMNYNDLAKKTEKFSGADIKSVCKEAAMRPIRKIFKKLELGVDSQLQTEEIDQNLMKVSEEDVKCSIEVTKPSGSKYAKRYLDWNEKFGADTDMK